MCHEVQRGHTRMFEVVVPLGGGKVGDLGYQGHGHLLCDLPDVR